MINLGFYSGKDMAPVYLEPMLADRIYEGISILLLTAGWVLAIVFYTDSSLATARYFLAPGMMTLLTVVFLWASRAPIRYYNFPVKLTTQNYIWQYRIATRFIRLLGVILNLSLLFCLFSDMESKFNVQTGLFMMLVGVTFAIMLVCFIGYYVIAFRSR